MTTRLRRTDDGSALIIALVFLAVFGLIVAALLSFSEVGLRAAASAKGNAQASAAADGAITAAIRRYSTTGPCDDFTSPPINGRAPIVRCDGPPPAGAKATRPVNSLLSLGTGSSGGITSTQELRLLGDVYSTTSVSTTATMVVQGEVSAVGTCTGPIQTTRPNGTHCATAAPSTADRSRGRDPDYTKATTAVPARRTVPAPDCSAGAGWLVTLKPGYYDDAAALSALTGPGSCNDKVVWLQPGTYYFDLTFRGGPGSWSVSNDRVVVVGGTPKGWDPAAAGRPTLNVPGSCKKEGDPGAFAGVQLIAGGGTRLDVAKGRMELCATPSTVDQQIALYGIGPDLPTHTMEATEITGDGFGSVLQSQTIDETPTAAMATAALTTTQPAASLSFGSFRPGVPSGSVIDAVGLLVKHQEGGNPVDLAVTADWPGRSGACGPAAPLTLAANPGPSGSRIDLKAACALTRPEDLAGLAVTYRATLATGGTAADERVDGIVVEVSYRTPDTRKATVALAATGFATPENAVEIGEQPDPLTADAVLSASGATTASLTLAGMGDPPLPALATIDSAVLRVAHREQGDAAAPAVTVPFPGGTCTNLPLPVRPDGIAEDRIDLKACGLNTPARLQGLTATYSAPLRSGGTAGLARLDGLWLELLSSGPSGPLPAAVRQASTATPVAFANPDRAKVIGEAPAPLTADATLAGAVDTASVRLDGFDRIPLVPGSSISSAKLRVAHQEDASVGSVRVGATVPAVPGYPGGTCPATQVPSRVGALATDVVDLAPCNLRTAEQLAGLATTYTAARTTVAVPVTQVPSTTGSVVEFDPTEVQAQGRKIDGTGAIARLNGIRRTASVTVSGYDQAPPPAGSAIDTAVLRIAHQDDGDVLPGGVTATVTFAGTTCPAAGTFNGHPGSIGVDAIDLRACGLTDPAQLPGLSVSYRIKRDPATGKKADVTLDGIELALTYRPPAVDRLDGIELDLVFQAPRFEPLCPAGPSGCDLLHVAPAAADTATRFVAGGTIYAPSAGVDVSMNGLKTQVLNRGVIARSIHLGLQPDPGYKRPTGVIPPEVVGFTAYPDETLRPTGSGPSPGFTGPANAKAMREKPTILTADAALDGTNPTASLGLSGFDQTTLGDSARFDAAVLRVRHQDVGSALTVTVKVGATTCVDHQALAPNPDALSAGGHDGEDQIVLPSSPRQCVVDRKSRLGGVTVTIDVGLDPPATTATARLDGVTLEVLSRPLLQASVTFDQAVATVQAWSVPR